MTKTQMAVGGGQTDCSLNSPKLQIISKKGFSIAEALVALLIGSLILGFSAPMISKQIKHNNFSDTQTQIINRQIEQIKTQNNDLIEEIKELKTKIATSEIPSHTIAFFNRTDCPKGWNAVKDKNGKAINGYYPRIANEGDEEIGKTKDQMVHRHKHVSPFLTGYSIQQINQLRYGPYNYPTKLWNASFNQEVTGDESYPEAPSMYNSHHASEYYANSWGGQFSLYSYGYPGMGHGFWLTYTSDGMNRKEGLFGLNSSGTDAIIDVTVCPNKDEGDKICKPSGNNYNFPYLKDMPLVGDENRPKSIIWLACEKD